MGNYSAIYVPHVGFISLAKLVARHAWLHIDNHQDCSLFHWHFPCSSPSSIVAYFCYAYVEKKKKRKTTERHPELPHKKVLRLRRKFNAVPPVSVDTAYHKESSRTFQTAFIILSHKSNFILLYSSVSIIDLIKMSKVRSSWSMDICH